MRQFPPKRHTKALFSSPLSDRDAQTEWATLSYRGGCRFDIDRGLKPKSTATTPDRPVQQLRGDDQEGDGDRRPHGRANHVVCSHIITFTNDTMKRGGI